MSVMEFYVAIYLVALWENGQRGVSQHMNLRLLYSYWKMTITQKEVTSSGFRILSIRVNTIVIRKKRWVRCFIFIFFLCAVCRIYRLCPVQIFIYFLLGTVTISWDCQAHYPLLFILHTNTHISIYFFFYDHLHALHKKVVTLDIWVPIYLIYLEAELFAFSFC